MQLSELSAAVVPLVQHELTNTLGTFRLSELKDASSHLLGLGKLFRPLLAVATYYALGGRKLEQIIPFVTPLEIIHTFTLIHDDLPCMDDALLRRGKPTVHLAHGEALAVLAGDALLNLALLRLSLAEGKISAQARLSLITAATQATHDVVEGQVLDLRGEGQDWGEAMLERLHKLKTGALLGACCEFGAILYGADPTRVDQLRALGISIGLAFQMRDDLLSLSSTDAAMGKTVGTDEFKGKATYARLLGVNGAEAKLAAITQHNLAHIGELSISSPGLLKEIAAMADRRQR